MIFKGNQKQGLKEILIRENTQKKNNSVFNKLPFLWSYCLFRFYWLVVYVSLDTTANQWQKKKNNF